MTTTLFGQDQRGLTFATMAAIAAAAYNNLSVNAALPAIGDDLGNLELLPWIVTIELIGSAVAVLAVGPVIDAVGTRSVYRTSLIAFAISCAACAFAPTLPLLIVARGLQGLTTGAIIANVMAALGLGVPEALRARAYAANSSVWGIMGVGGPALAALVLTVADWPAIFLVNIPVAVVSGVIGWNAFPGPTEDSVSAPSDYRGLSIMVAFTLLSLGVLSTIAWWTPVAVLAAAVMVWAYVRHERTVEPPVLRVRHVTSPEFRTLHVTAFLVITGGVCANAFLPIYVKGVRGATTSQAAFAVVFLTVGWTTGAFISSRVSELRTGEFAVKIAAAALAVSAIGAAVSVGVDASLWFVFAAYLGLGLGMGGVSSAGLGVLQSGAKPAEMGRVNSAHQFIRTLGFTYGAALGGALIFVTVQRRLGDADLVRELLSDEDVLVSPELITTLGQGFKLAVVVSAALCCAAFVFAMRLQQPTARP